MAFDITSKLTVAMASVGADKVAGGIKSVWKEVDGLTQASSMLTSAWRGVLGLFAAGAFSGMVKGIIDGQAALHDLSIQTGMSVAMLGQLKAIGALSETSIQSIAGAGNKLAKSLATANEEGKGASLALRALGIDFDNFKKMNPDDRMLEVARAMGQFRDGSEKSAAAMLLFGKQGADLLPFLADLAEEHDKVTAKVTDAEKETRRLQAAMSDAYGDNLAKIRKQGEGWKKDLAMGLLPVMYEVTEAVLKMSNGTGGLKEQISQMAKDGTFAEWGRNALNILSYLIDAGQILYRVIETLVKATAGGIAALSSNFESIAGVFGKVLAGDFSGALQEFQGGISRFRTIAGAAYDDIVSTWSRPTLGAAFRKQMDVLKGKQAADEDTRKSLANLSDHLKEQEKATKGVTDEYANLLAASRAHVAEMQLEINGGEKLTTGQKKLLELQAKIEQGTIEYNETKYQQLALQYREEAATEKRLALAKKELAWLEQSGKANDEAFAAIGKRTAEIEKQAKEQEKANAQFGMTEEALAGLEVAELEAAAAAAELKVEMFAAADPAIALEFLNQADALKRLAAAKEKSAKLKGEDKARQVAEEISRSRESAFIQDWRDASETISDILETAIRAGGKDGWAAVRKDIARSAVNAVVRFASSGLGYLAAGSGAVGGAGGAAGSLLGQANGAYGTGSSLAYLAGGAYGLTGATTGASAASLTYANAVGAVGGDSLGALIAANGSWSGVAAGGTAAGAGAGAGAAAGAAEGAGAAAAGGAGAGGMSAMAALGWAAVVAAVLYAVFGDHSKWSMGSVAEGQFGSDGKFAPTQFQDFNFGTNTEHERDAKFQRGLVDSYATSLAAQAKLFGGSAAGLGLSLGTDTDADGQVAAIVRLLKGGSVIGGTQTGSGAFGGSDPGVAATKLEGDQLAAWFSGALPQIIVQGLQQSDLDQRFADYFDSVASGADLTAEKAQELLNTASGVKALADAFAPLGGVFAQLETASVASIGELAKAAGGFDALGQGISSYYQTFYTEAERAQITTDSLTKSLTGMGLTLPDLSGGAAAADAQWRALVDAQDLSTEAGRKNTLQLIAMSGTFDQLAQAAEKAAQAERERLKKIDDTKLSLQVELLQAQGDKTGALALQRQIELSSLTALEAETRVATGTFTNLKQQVYAASDAAQLAAETLAKLQSLTSGVDSVVSGFLSGGALQTYFADRILQILGEAGINGTRAGVLASTKDDILALWNAVGVDGKQAILDALPMWEQLQDQVLKTSGVAASMSDLVAAYNEINPAAETLVDKWRRSRQEMELLQQALDDIDGKPAATKLGQLQDLVNKRSGLANVQGSLIGMIDDARTSRVDQASLNYARQAEQNAAAQFAATNDPQVAQAWITWTKKRIQIEGQLQQKAAQDRYDAEYESAMDLYNVAKQTDTLLTQQQKATRDAAQEQIDALTKMRELAKTIPEVLGNIQAGDLSILSVTGRLGERQKLFDRSLQTGNDPAGALQALLQQAQGVYGGATAQYGAIYRQAMADYEQKIQAGAISADTLLPNAVRQLNAMNKLADQAMPKLQQAVVDSGDEMVAALTGINTSVTAGLGTLTTDIRTMFGQAQSEVSAYEALIAKYVAPFLVPGEIGPDGTKWDGGGSGGGYGDSPALRMDWAQFDEGFSTALDTQTTAVVDELKALHVEVVGLREQQKTTDARLALMGGELAALRKERSEDADEAQSSLTKIAREVARV